MYLAAQAGRKSKLDAGRVDGPRPSPLTQACARFRRVLCHKEPGPNIQVSKPPSVRAAYSSPSDSDLASKTQALDWSGK